MSKPVDKMQDFPVDISFWEKENENGKWMNASVSKVYKDNEGWQRTNNFTRGDMLKLHAMMPEALGKMQELEKNLQVNQNQSTTPDIEQAKTRVQERENSQPPQTQNQSQGQEQ